MTTMPENKSNRRYLACRGEELRPHLQALGALRIEVFREFPYLYDGDLAYEMHYLQRYVKSPLSFTELVFDADSLVGATTAIALEDEDPSFQLPLTNQGYEANEVVYFGESILRNQYRGLGIGKRFMLDRLAFARSLSDRKWAAFCSVIRSGEADESKKQLQFWLRALSDPI